LRRLFKFTMDSVTHLSAGVHEMTLIYQAQVIGTAEVPLNCVVEDSRFSFDGCIPVMTSAGCRRFQSPKTQGTLQVFEYIVAFMINHILFEVIACGK